MTEQPHLDKETAPLPAAANDHAAPLNSGEASRPRGKLKIFLSYAPGTGKTLAMLSDAFRRLQEGTDVVVGFVDTPGELLAMQLLDRFEVLAHRVVASSGISYQGMDLDAVLARKPQLVLVDHLARANPPGLRHEMRYLEVEEVLNAGIDVYTTLNIYQLESQVDAVAYLTGVVVQETIPDRILEDADQLELVDMPPQELLASYDSDRISVPRRIEVQMEKFFQPANLFALRELTLRYLARRSNLFMRSYLKNNGMQVPEASSARLLVCISDSPNASRLIRAGRRMADETHAEWTVIHVETPDRLEQQADGSSPISQNMRLAELLGAHTETLTGRSVVAALREYIHKHHIHRVMIGRSSRHWYHLFGTSLAEQLLRDDPTTNIYVVGSDYTPQPFHVPRFWGRITRSQFLGSLVLATIPTVLGLALTPSFISRSANLIMLYLLSVVIASITFGLTPALLTALFSVLAFNYFFVPPIYSLIGFAPENAITFVSVLIFSVIISTLVARERSLTQAAQRRAEQVTQLYELSRDLATAVDMPDILRTVLEHFERTFDRELVILLPKNSKLALCASSAVEALDTSELTAAEWAFQQGRAAGNNTGTFSYAAYRYFPLETSRGIVGVIGVCMVDDNKPELHPEQVRMLGTFVTKAASSIERALFAEEASQAEILRATEKLQTALLNSISHDLRTPLASITGVLDSLRMDEDLLDPETRRELVETAYGEADRLNRLVGNLLDMTRLESGTLRISRDPGDIQDVIGSALNAISTRLGGRPINIDLPPDLPLVPFDFVLIQQVLVNLVDNAAKYSPENEPIEISAQMSNHPGTPKSLQVEVADRGPGIPEEDLEHIFEKFYRVKRFEHVVGTGLGLSICKGVVEVHGGRIWAENNSQGGVKMIFTLPLQPAKGITQEAAVQAQPEEVGS